MPTLFRLLALIVIVCGLVIGAMVALAVLVQPESRVIIVSVPLPKPPAKP